MKRIASFLAIMAGLCGTAVAQGIDDPPSAFSPNEGIVRSIDKAAGEIVVRHGQLTEIGMPPMTMAFEVSDATLLDKVKAGDRVTLRVELLNGRFTVTRIEPAWAVDGQ